MTEPILLKLFLAWALMALVAGSLLIRLPGAAWQRTLGILALGASAWWQFDGIQALGGWPTGAPLPERFLFHGAVIEEPDAARGTPGRIDLWVTPLVDDRADGAPRAFRLPYSEADHRSVQAARQRMRNGAAQMGRRGDATPSRQSPDTARAAIQSRFQLDDLPAPALPEK